MLHQSRVVETRCQVKTDTLFYFLRDKKSTGNVRWHYHQRRVLQYPLSGLDLILVLRDSHLGVSEGR